MAKKKPGAGQTVLVTGGSTGIGVDLAECFARDGYDLILAARSEPGLRAVADRLSNSYNVKAAIFPLVTAASRFSRIMDESKFSTCRNHSAACSRAFFGIRPTISLPTMETP